MAKITYGCVLTMSKSFQIVGAALLILLFVFRVIIYKDINSFALWVQSFYFIFFALMVVGIECGIKKLKETFFFMNFYLGKALWNFYLGCMTLTGVHQALEIPIAIFFFFTALLFFMLFFCYRKEERERIQRESELKEKPAQ